MTESLSLTIGVPFIVGLVVPVILVEGVVEIAIEPEELGHDSEENWHLGVIVAIEVVASTDRVELLVEVRGHNLVAKIVVGLLPEVLWEVRRVEVDRCHIIKLY